MGLSPSRSTGPVRIRTYALALAVAWTGLVASILASSIVQQQQQTRRIALLEARAHIDKDTAIRLWAANRGGVYVPADEHTPPNPHLAHVPDRDVLTASGKHLTLMNAAYMLRQMLGEFGSLYGVQGHLTSLKPVRPQNRPDAWEQRGLHAFEHGASEVGEFTTLKGEPYLRVMRPVVTQRQCLKCHASQGYRVGDIRGGVAVALPLTALLAEEHAGILNRIVAMATLWLVGLAALGLGSRDLERRVAEREALLRANTQARESLEAILNSVPVMVGFVDEAWAPRWTNRCWDATLGWALEDGQAIDILNQLVPEPEEQQRALRFLQGEGGAWEDYRVHVREGRILDTSWALVRLSDGSRVLIGLDLTERVREEEERRQFEARMQHTQRLESLGVLAGGVAHDFNNLLTGILGNIGLATMRLEPSSPAARHISEAEAATMRAAELANQMLAYSGKGRFVIERCDLSQLVREMARLLATVVPKSAQFRCELDPDLPPVEGDVAQIRQVVMNLITNAGEAIGPRDGTIHIRTRLVDADHALLNGAYLTGDLPEGRYVELEVSDDGCGMDAETQARLFEPFFTTKFTGRGLGMAAVLGIVRGHRGAIRVDSRPGEGTTFRVLFPVAG